MQWPEWLQMGPGGHIVLGLGLTWFTIVFVGTMISPKTFSVTKGQSSRAPNDDIDSDVAGSGEPEKDDKGGEDDNEEPNSKRSRPKRNKKQPKEGSDEGDSKKPSADDDESD